MSVLSWIVLGLIVGVLAKWIMPGADPGGLVMTIVLGVVGAFVGGWAAGKLGVGGVSGLDLPSVLTATAGAVVLLVLYRLLRGRGRGSASRGP